MRDDDLALNTRGPADERIEPPASFVEQANVSGADVAEFEHPDDWDRAAALLEWTTPYDAVFDEETMEWFPGGGLNATGSCLDRHLDRRKNQRALVWEGQRGETRTYTYLELYREVNAVAAALRSLGVGEDDVVTLHLPVVPELPVVMLACARIGAPHAVVFAGYSADALAERMNTAGSAVLFTCDGYYRRGDAVSSLTRTETACVDVEGDVTTVVVDRLGSDYTLGDEDYQYGALRDAHAGETVDPVERAATDDLFYSYTSGTTGAPKRVTHTTGGYLAYAAWTSHAVLDVKPRDTYWCTADIGWITGHSYVVYGPLALGTTVLLQEGGTDFPSRRTPWELIERHAVDVFYTSPTAIRTFMKWGPEYPERYDRSSLRLLGTVGEPISPQAWQWFYEHVGGGDCPVVDTWWQTETGGHLLATLPGVHDMKPGAAGMALPGVSAAVVGEDGTPVGPGRGGYLVIDTPWPGMARELSTGERWAGRAEEEAPPLSAFEWAYPTGDGAFVDEDGYVTILGRVDDVLNVSGHRLGTVEIESAIASVDGVAEAAVVDVDHGGSRGLFAYVSPTDNSPDADSLAAAIGAAVENAIGRFARPDEVVVTAELPKTSSGKIVRRLLTDIANGEEPGDTSALRNPEVVGEIESSIFGD
ncbi:acetate--CoA ligase [Halobacteriales archaeon QH_2_66_30]|nr:MAG: acetate--CoA ligase [Halobacteriales archaeon QH_2_66_30]